MRVPSWARASGAHALILLTLALGATRAAANPAANVTEQFTQPNGTVIELRLWGDEYANGWETLDGQTVYLDQATSTWYYATLDASGALTSSGTPVGMGGSAQPLHLRPTVTNTFGGGGGGGGPLRGQVMLDAAPGWASGNTNVLVIMVQFPADAGDPDGNQPAVSASFTSAQMQGNLFGATSTGPGNWTDYYDQISFGNLHVLGTVVGPFTVANDKNDYDDGPLSDADLVKEAIQLADASVDFSAFDNDGNGEVDMVAICYAGNGPDNGLYKGANVNTNKLWPHAASIASVNVDGGARHVSQYFMAPELLNSNPRMRTIGVYCHEFGHKLGLPDLYDTDDSSDGLGHWCLMASGSWCSNNPGTENGESPAHMSAWCKSFLGWMTPTVKTDQQVGLNVPQAETNAFAIQLRDNPGGNDWVGSGEYFLIENRQRTGFDRGLDGCGLLVFHVDEAQSTNKNEGHTAGTHRLVDLEEAGTTNLDGGMSANRGDGDDPFPGSTSQVQWDDASDPSAKLYSGSNSNQRMRVLSTCSASMAISLNNQPPVADAGSDQLNVECTSTSGASVSLSGSGSSDPDGDNLTYTWSATGITFSNPNSATPTATFPDGYTTVTLTVSDGIESDTDQMQVRVLDTTPPTITCPASITVECSEHGGTPATDPAIAAFLAAATTTDLCGTPTISTDAPTFFPHGSTTVKFTATDESTNQATCSATVDVVDTTPPTISVSLSRDALWPPNHKMSDIIATVVVTDVCDPNPTFVLTSITSNEPDNGLGDGDTPGDIGSAGYATADVAFQLRSERSGTGTGRVYTVIYTASDDDGNTARDTAWVRVPKSQAGNATAASGYGDGGLSLDGVSERFLVVIPTTLDQIAWRVDAAHACVGNTQFSLAPESWWLADVTGDRKNDLVLAYSTPVFQQLTGRATEVVDETTTGTRMPVIEGAGAPLVTDASEPVGLHYVTAGRDLVIDDVFALGTPVSVTGAPPAESATTSRAGDTVTPSVTAPTVPMADAFDGRILSLAQPARVRFDVYNVLGQRVRTVVDGEFGVGQHSLTWDGTDASGRRAGNGIYFYRVSAGSFRAVRKVSLAR